MKTNTSIVIKELNNTIGANIIARAPKGVKEHLITECINPTKYTFLGYVDSSNFAIFEARYHNVRDNQGRFAKVRNSRK